MLVLPRISLDQEFVACARAALEREVFVQEGRLQDSPRTRRTTYEFGYSYQDLKRGNRHQTQIPDYLTTLCAETLRGLKTLSPTMLPAAADFTNCIISDYHPGFKLEPHIDEDMARASTHGAMFYFGEHIVGVVLEADKAGFLYLLDKRGRMNSRRENTGDAFLLNGPNRHDYKHGVATIMQRRVSATFRTVHFLD